MEKYMTVSALSGAIIFFAAISVMVFRCTQERIAGIEQLLRSKYLGGILCSAALAWCVPQIQAVAWTWMADYAWFLAAGALVLCVLYLDNLAARGFAGLLILGAYYYLDMIFDCKLNLGVSGALAAWVWGAVGIVIAAKPCYLRDFLRLAAQKSFWRYLALVLAAVTVLLLGGVLVLYWKTLG